MWKFAEKLEFMKVRAVKVCVKAEIGRISGHKPCFEATFQKAASEKKLLDSSG